MADKFSVASNVYVGDFGVQKISKKTLEAYDLGGVDLSSRLWRRNSRLRKNYEDMCEDLSSVQRYLWKRDEDGSEL